MRTKVSIGLSALFAGALVGLGTACASEIGGDDDDGNKPPCEGEDCPDDIGPLGDGVATLSGSAEPGAVDGVRGVARFNNPVNLAVGPDGTVYIADFDNGRVRVATPTGDVATLTEQPGFERPFGLALSRDGRTLYVQTDVDDAGANDGTTGTIWKVDVSSGYATVLARHLGRPRGLAVMQDGTLVLSDYMHHTVRLMNPTTGAVRDLAGAKDLPGRADGTGAAARFHMPYDVVVDASGHILVADQGNHLIRQVTGAGVVTTVAGTGDAGWRDGAASQAQLFHPQGLAIDGDGVVYVSDADNFRVRRLSPDGQVSTVAGDGEPGFRDDGSPLAARLFGLEGLDVSPDGTHVYIADGNRGDDGPFHRVRRLKVR